MTSARARAGAVLATVAVTCGFAVATASPADAVSATQAGLVSAVPASFTPNINDGTVYAIAQVGSSIVVGGSFTNVTPYKATAALTRNRIVAFDQTTGAVSTTFVPSLDGTVNSLIPGPIANTVYVGGAFTNVGTTKSKGLALLNLSNGSLVTGFKAPAFNGTVQDLRLSAGRLFVAGGFTTVAGVQHQGIATLKATTGALDPYLNVQLTGHHNYNGTGASGAVGGRAMDISPNGTRAIVVGNFKNADGVVHDQIVMLDLNAASGVVDPNWNTSQYSAPCANGAFDTYVEDVDFSPDGSYFAIAATGGGTFSSNIDGTRSLCDTATRWETSSTGTNVKPSWVDYTGNDTFWSVAATGSTIYVGGHQRWANNESGSDSPGPGAVPRAGIAALDPINGLPYSWNPGRNPRGAGAYALLATPQGLYVGSDTNYIGNFKYKRSKIAFFPLAGGTTPPPTTTAQLPSNMYEAGQLPNSTNSGILYRVNAAGPAVGAIDNGPDWMADESGSDPGAAFHNPDNNAAGYSCCVTTTSAVPASTPISIFDTERWDGGSQNDRGEMNWTFPVTAGTHVGVRLYFANRYSGTSQPGQRVFDVAVDGANFLDRYDVTAEVGDQVGTMKQFDVTAPATGQVTIDWTHEVENPNVDGIELVNLDAPANPPAAQGDLTYHAMDGTNIGPSTTVPGTGIDWSTTRGAFVAGNYVFYGSTDGNFYRASFNGTTVGPPSVQNAYEDPLWSSVETGSGQTYKGVKPGYYSEISSITGQFFSNGRIYYSLLGQPDLHWRWFEPESGIIGSAEYTVSGADFSNIAGLTLSGSTLYYADRSDGTLHTVSFTNGTPDGSATATVSAPGIDWRTRSLFLYGKASFPNKPPTAAGAISCTGLNCNFDAANSSDPDGSVVKWAWDFGDGTTGSGKQVSHGYAQAGDKPVTLTVTDDSGATATWTGTASPTGTAPAVGFVSAADYHGSSTSPAVTAPAGISAGDTELLFVSANTAGATPAGLTGWTQLTKITNWTLETTVFRRTAQAGDSGTKVTVPLTKAAVTDVQFVDYSHVSSVAPTVKTAIDYTTATHVAPAVPVTAGGSWVLTYWTDRSSSTTAWTRPAALSLRASGVPASGSARVTAILADSGVPVTTGTYPAKTATVNAASGRGNMISIVLTPGA